MPRRVFVHVGCPKTGTSYLQSVLWHNQKELQRQGLLVPLRYHFHYATALSVRQALDRFPNGPLFAQWYEELLAAVRSYNGNAVITHELLAAARKDHVAGLFEALAPAELHVVITARDLARQLPAEWQQQVKAGGVRSMEEYVGHVKAHRRPANWFWSVQDVADIADRWGSSLSPDRVHIVTVPPKGSAPSLLWERFGSVLGIDAAGCDLDVSRSNESLGVVEVELLRRVNPRREKYFERRERDWLKRRLSNEMLAQRTDSRKFGYDPAVHPWVVEAGQEMVERLRSSAYDVVGDLDDLVPPAEPERGADPGDVTTGELLQVSLETLLQSMARMRELERDVRELKAQLKDSGTAQPRTPFAEKRSDLRNRASAVLGRFRRV